MLCSLHDHAPAQPPRLPQSLDAAWAIPSGRTGLRAIERALEHEKFQSLAREQAPMASARDDRARASDASTSSRCARPRRRKAWCGSTPTPRCRPARSRRCCARPAAPCLAVDEVMARQGRQRVRRDAPARPSRRDRDADGLLPVQQRRDRGAPCAEAAWRRARRDRRFRRASRQRQPGDFLERRDRDVLLDPPDAALSRHRRGVGARRAEHHRQRAAAPGRRRRAVPRGDGDRRSCRGSKASARISSSSRPASTRTCAIRSPT